MSIGSHVERFAGYRVVDYQPAATDDGGAGGASRREFQLIEGNSRKFWAIRLAGNELEVNFGRIGTAGQTQRKEFKTAGEAVRAHDKLIAEKTAKGYVEVGGVAAPSPKPASRKKTSHIYRVGLSSHEYFASNAKFADKFAAFL